MKNTFWTKEEDNLLIKYLDEGKSFQQAADLIKTRERRSCEARAKRLKIHSKFVWAKKKTDENFWSTPNALNCYWAGYAATDGCLLHSVNKKSGDMYYYQLLLGDKDFDQVQRFKEDTKSESKISRFFNKHVKCARIKVACKQWGIDLQKNFNVTPRKTFTLQPPNLTDESLIFSFIIGAVDGDGCIRLTSEDKTGKRRKVPSVCITGGSYDFMRWIFDTLIKYFPRSLTGTVPSLYEFPSVNGVKYIVSLIGIRACQIIAYLRQYSCPKLARKWDNPEVLSIIEEYKKEYPDFFDFSHLPTPI